MAAETKTLNKKEKKNSETISKSISNKKVVSNKKNTKSNNVKDKKITKKTVNKKDVDKKNDTNKTNNKINNTKSKSNKNKSTKKKNGFLKKIQNKLYKFFEKDFHLDILDLMIIVVVVALLSCVGTGTLITLNMKDGSTFFGSLYESDDNLNKFINIYKNVKNNYYEEIDTEGMIDSALDGMMDYLGDKYSIYLDSDQSNVLSNTIENSYDGIGIVLIGNLVVEVYDGTSAKEAGIEAGDVIVSINNTEVDENNYDNISSLLNEEGSSKVVVKRDNQELEFTVEKGKVNIPVVNINTYKGLNGTIGYISLSSFSKTSHVDFQEGLLELEKEGITSLIIDLRSNSGGYLDSATNIASIFLEEGKVIYSLEYKDENKEVVDETEQKSNLPIIILVNGDTASSSEVLTAALKDSYGASIVGTVTYGKGKVQNYAIYGDTSIKYTSAKWLRPNGECIDGIGITPDYVVQNEFKNNIYYDRQLDKAIELLNK